MVGYSPWGRKEWDTTERLHFTSVRHRGFPVDMVVKNPPAHAGDTETHIRSLGQEDAWRRKWQPIPVFLPG